MDVVVCSLGECVFWQCVCGVLCYVKCYIYVLCVTSGFVLQAQGRKLSVFCVFCFDLFSDML